jgi:hypothetical protein
LRADYGCNRIECRTSRLTGSTRQPRQVWPRALYRPSAMRASAFSSVFVREVQVHPRRADRPEAEGNCVLREGAWGATGGERAIRRTTNAIRPCRLASHLANGEAQTRMSGKPATLRDGAKRWRERQGGWRRRAWKARHIKRRDLRGCKEMCARLSQSSRT